MLSNEQVAVLVAKKINQDFDILVSTTPLEEQTGRGRDPEQYFRLELTQEFGVFKMIMKSAWIKVRAGIVRPAEGSDDKPQLCVFVALHYDHLHGGSNGSNIATYWFDAEGNLVAERAG